MASAPARPPLPPFGREDAIRKVRLAEDAWNSRDPERVALAYTPDSQWRNRTEFLAGRDAIVALTTAPSTRRIGSSAGASAGALTITPGLSEFGL